ncbi:uncharacterized protein [Palaemon carinicauda]|uniref:uncharacterized protein n=1 Tax=Palaemon carinicauda TaxID=392227 RepID=UPI0035B61A37
MQDSSTLSHVNALLLSWSSRFSIPDDITTDRGPAFLSDVWGALTKSLGITTHNITSYNPTANRMVERAHRSLKTSLMAHCSDDNWNAQIPLVHLGLRTAPRSNREPSSAEKVFEHTIAVPGDFFPTSSYKNNQIPERIRNAVTKFTLCHQTFNDITKTFMPQDLRKCYFLFIRDDAHRQSL